MTRAPDHGRQPWRLSGAGSIEGEGAPRETEIKWEPMDPTPALLDAVRDCPRKGSPALYRVQAQAVRDDAEARIGDLLRRGAEAAGHTRRQLAEMLGYANLTKGIRRIDGVLRGEPGRGDVQQRLAGFLNVTEGVDRIRDDADQEAQVLRAKTRGERDMLRQHLPCLLDHAAEISADRDLRLALPCEEAVVDIMLVGRKYLPLGALLEEWNAELKYAPESRFFVVGTGGSPLREGRGVGIRGGDDGMDGEALRSGIRARAVAASAERDVPEAAGGRECAADRRRASEDRVIGYHSLSSPLLGVQGPAGRGSSGCELCLGIAGRTVSGVRTPVARMGLDSLVIHSSGSCARIAPGRPVI